MDEATLTAAAERFKAAARKYHEVNEQADNLELDVKLAIRTGYPAAAAEKARDDYRRETWLPAYRERKEAALALCAAMGVQPDDLKYSL